MFSLEEAKEKISITHEKALTSENSLSVNMCDRQLEKAYERADVGFLIDCSCWMDGNCSRPCKMFLLWDSFML